MTLNCVMAVTLRYFTEFGKLALQKTICGGIYASLLYFSACTVYNVVVKKVHVRYLLMSFLFGLASLNHSLVSGDWTHCSADQGPDLQKVIGRS